MADNELDKAIEEIHCEGCHYMDCTGLDEEATAALKTLLTSEKNKAVVEELINYRLAMDSDREFHPRSYISDRLAQLNSLQGE
jgi:hypothetical protein